MKVKQSSYKKFDESYVLLEEMYADPFFPDFLVREIELEIRKVIQFLETEEESVDLIQEKFDEMTRNINKLESKFYENNSEIESLARRSIASAVFHIIAWFNVRIDIQDALRYRTW